MKSNFIFTLNPVVGKRSTLRHLAARGIHGEQATHQLCESYKKPFVMIVKFKFYIALMAHGNFSYVKAQYDDFKKNVGGVAVSRAGNIPANTPARVANLWLTYRADSKTNRNS